MREKGVIVRVDALFSDSSQSFIVILMYSYIFQFDSLLKYKVILVWDSNLI